MTASEIKYPVGIQTFSDIINGGYVYVDKTALVYRLVSRGKYYFLSRPRRFGKSLLLSTLKAYFEGHKELFKGLFIENLEKDWKCYPVIHLSLSQYNPSEPESLEKLLDNSFRRLEHEYGCEPTTESLSLRFGNIIYAVCKKTASQVVVLIDEYDAPLVANLENEKVYDRFRNLLKAIYSNLKEMDEYIRFGMLTGVSRFSRMTIFSGINNLNDISLVPEYSEICGLTQKEIESAFRIGIENLSKAMGTDIQGAVALLKENYDGYHFTRNSVDIYNPFSLLLALDNCEIAPYWFRSGTPDFLVRRLRREKVLLAELLTENVNESAISDIDTFRTSILSLLFQTGYLTIKDYDARRKRYRLGVPNKEVESGLFSEMLAYNMDMDKYRVDNRIWDIRDALEDGNPDRALDMIRSMFAAVPANLTQNMPELYYENNLFLVFRLIGIDARAEWWTADGRIDMLLVLPSYIYIMELKLDSTPEQALAQIDSKDYSLQFRYDGRQIFKIGINYSRQTRNIDSWKIIIV
ncbi:MAG: ATP-binding protein [Muribaculaceae bacterium]|nr:ATP-binding protein [Muribaculaceae bacterium]